MTNRILIEQQDKISFANEALERQKNSIESQANDLKTMNNRLIELDNLKEGLVGMIVHDLKNPLNTIINSTKEQETKQAGKQMLNMVLNILDVQKFENTKIKLDTNDFSLYQCGRDAFRQIKMLLERKSVQLENRIPELCTFRGDFELVNRVFVNLLTNAIKYTPINGRIIVEAENPVNGFIRVSVTDNGPGIPPEKINSVFYKFSDVFIKKSGGIRSSGLGLTFCKLVVEAHGGHIYVDTELGLGTSFRFLLPEGKLIGPGLMEKELSENKVENELCELSGPDKEYLTDFTSRLRKHSVFEFSDIDEIIQEIEIRNHAIETWKEELENALKACNEDKFRRLTNI